MEGNYCYQYPHPAITADCLVFACDGAVTKLLLIERRHEPCKGRWAFPGGFMNINETADAAARRELQEETGLTVGELHQVGAYTAVERDPRERVVTIAYYAELDSVAAVEAADDAFRACWWSLDDLPELAFDHAEILRDALEKRKYKSQGKR